MSPIKLFSQQHKFLLIPTPIQIRVAAEIIARINEAAFDYLEAPIKRITGFDVPFPYFQVEEHFLPESEEIVSAVKETLDWK